MPLTLAIPFHRIDSLLERAVESVVDDLTSNDELLLINDSPFSNILAEEFLASALGTLKSAVSIIKNDGKGIVCARNAALSNARFEVLSFLDSDDVWVPGRRERHLEFLRRNPEAPGVCSEILYLCVHGRYLGRSRLSQKLLRKYLNLELKLFPRIRTSSTSIRVESALKAGGFLESESDCEDFGLWLRLQKGGDQLLIDKAIGAKYTIHSGQLSAIIGSTATQRLRALTMSALIEEEKKSPSRFSRSIIRSIDNGGFVDWALTGANFRSRQLYSDLLHPKLLLITIFLVVTAVVVRRQTCPVCSANG